MTEATRNLLEQHFDTAFAAPDGIARLRELILTLAMQGKLVDQDPNDPPASELLTEIEAEKQRLVKAGKIKKPKSLPPIKEEEVPYELPQGWEWVRFGDIAAIERGGSPRPIKAFITADPDGLNWIKIGDTDQGGKYITSTNEKIRPEGLVKTRMVYPGDFLLTNSMSFGRPYITKIQGCIHDGWLRISPPESLEKDYLYRLLSSSFIRKMFEAAAAGAVVLNLNSVKVRELPIPLPPLPEQHRIVARIDQLMARCDELERLRKEREEKRLAVHAAAIRGLLDTLDGSAWDFIQQHFGELYTVKENVAELRKAILQLAVMGRLVPQDPGDPPASELLKEIETEKQRLLKAGKIKKPKPLPPIKPEKVPYDLPQGWKWARVWDVAELITSGSRDWAKFYSDSGAIFVTMGNLSRGSYQLRMDTIRYVVPPVNGEGSRTKLEENDLLISITGDVGNLGLIPANFGEAYINQHTCLLRFMGSIRNRYFPELLRSPLAKEQFDAPQRGIKNSFRLGDVGEMIIPLPPLPEQQRIVAKIDQLMALCDALEKQIDAATGKQTKLLAAMMAQV